MAPENQEQNVLRKAGFLPLLLLAAGLLLLPGCGKHQGELGWLHEASEPTRNYRVVKSVTGTATSWSLLGMGTNQWNLYDQARRDLYGKADLQPDQRLINRTLDERTIGFPPTSGSGSGPQGFFDPIIGLFQVYSQKTVHLSGEVVEITGPVSNQP